MSFVEMVTETHRDSSTHKNTFVVPNFQTMNENGHKRSSVSQNTDSDNEDGQNVLVEEYRDIGSILAEEEGTDNRSPSLSCKVCGDRVTGMYFGAVVCVPCKTFFLRYASDSSSFECKFDRKCEITIITRTQCKYCRFHKCIEAGMNRKVRPTYVQVNEGQQLCSVCSDVANGVHFGVITCEGCKKFFRRGLSESSSYTCKNDGSCPINPRTRNSCRYCRFQKCLITGMSREAIQMGRPSKMRTVSNDGDNVVEAKKKKLVVPLFESFSDEQKLEDWLKHYTEPKQTAKQTSDQMDFSDQSRSKSSPDGSNRVRCNSINFGKTISASPGLLQSFTRDASPKTNCENSVKTSDSEKFCNEKIGGEDKSRRYSVSDFNGRRKSGSKNQEFISEDAKKEAVGPCLTRALSMSSGGYCQVVEKSPELSNDTLANYTNDTVFTPIITGTEPKLKDCLDFLNCKSLQNENGFGSFHAASNFIAPSAENAASPSDIVVPALPSCHNPHFQSNLSMSSPKIDFECNLDSRSKASCSSDMSCSPTSVRTIHSPPYNFPTRQLYNDRDSPYNSVLTLVKSCQLYTEASKNYECDDGKKMEDFSLDSSYVWSDSIGDRYWLKPDLPDEDVMFTDKHLEVINRLLAAYDRFVQTGTNINKTLNTELQNWMKQNGDRMIDGTLAKWIQIKVIPVYTFTSITYCKSLPGFQDFAIDDQATIIRLGQSQSRIMVAAVHWFNSEEKNFKNFLSWRPSDLFKTRLISYAEKIHSLELDHIESAVLNVLSLIATDYPGLKKPQIIEESRRRIIVSFRAYTTAKYGMPNSRLESLFAQLPEARRLGYLHYKMTMTESLKAEEVEKMTKQ